MDDHEEADPTGGPPANDSNLTPIAPSAEDRAHGGTDGDPPHVPTKAEILGTMVKMPGLIAVGVLTVPRANAMRGVYGTMLAHLDSGAASSTAIGADESVLAILRQQPELLKFIEPFLTAEQIQLVIRAASQ